MTTGMALGMRTAAAVGTRIARGVIDHPTLDLGGSTMAKNSKDPKRRAGHAAQRPRPEEYDTQSRRSGHIGSGQEAKRGHPHGHHEHQSQYGGGGPHGGKK